MDETDDTAGGYLGAAQATPGAADASLQYSPQGIAALLSRMATRNTAEGVSAADRFKAAQARIGTAYAGPTQGDMLMKLSQAMLSQSRVPGFGGFAGNVVGALNDTSDAARVAQAKRAEALVALQDQYDTDVERRAGAGDKNLLAAYGLMAKSDRPIRSAISGFDGRVLNLDTGEQIGGTTKTALPPPEAIALLRANPTFAVQFDQKYGLGFAKHFLGQN